MHSSFLSNRSRAVVSAVVLLAGVALAAAGSAASRPLPTAPSPVPSGAPAAQPTTAPPVLAKWGTKGTGDGQFDEPSQIAVGPLGDVYVTDSRNDRVQVFDEDGRYEFQFGKTGSKDGEFDWPRGIAVGPTGDVYVMDANHGRIQVFTPGGTFLRKWGRLGHADGEFDYAWSVAVDLSGNVYVADMGNHRVQKFSSAGGFLAAWGTEGSGAAQFKDLKGIAVSPSGHVFTVDGENARVTEFSTDGDVLDQWGGPGRGQGQFLGPIAVDVDTAGRVYVLDTGNNRIQVFGADGAYMTQWRVSNSRPYDIAVARSGTVYLVENYEDWVCAYGPVATVRDKKPPTTTVAGLDDQWHNTPVTLTYTAKDEAGGSGVAYTETHIQAWLSPLWSPWVRGSTYTVAADADHSDDGDRTLEFRSVDVAGNVEKKHKVLVLIDTTAPRVKVFPATVTSGKRGKVTFRVTEQLSREIRVQLRVEDAAGDTLYETASSWLVRRAKNSWSFVCPLGRGTYDVLVAAEDLAGNVGSAGQAKLTVK